MGKKKRKINEFENNADEAFIDPIEEFEDGIESDLEDENNIKINQKDEILPIEKIESCKVIFIKDKSFVIDFKGHGINIKTQGIIDKDLIHSYVDVKYRGEIGEKDFEYHLIFQ